MTQEHPITPPPELVRQWAQVNGEKDLERFWAHIATQAARWGADQELEACCEWIDTPAEFQTVAWNGKESDQLRAARRPKPSLKQQALAALDVIEDRGAGPTTQEMLIRRALEALPD